jgi:Amidohydrolase family
MTATRSADGHANSFWIEHLQLEDEMFQNLLAGARLCARHIGPTAVVTLMLAFGSLQSAPLAELAIRHVNVIDVAGARVQGNQRVIVQEGRITAIEPEQPAAPQAATVIDAKGKFLIPGLWDMHYHLYLSGYQTVEEVPQVVLPLFIANGVLGVREMGDNDVDIAPLVRLRDEIETGKRLGPHIVVTGRRIFDIGATEAREAVRALKAAGADFAKVSSKPSRKTYLAVADECKRVGLPFAGHIPVALTARDAIEAGQSSIEHMGNGKLREVCYGYLPEGAAPPTETDPLEMARFKEAFNAALTGQPSALWHEYTRTWLVSAAGMDYLSNLKRAFGMIESLIVLHRQPVAEGAKLAVRAQHTKGEHTHEFQIDRQGKIGLLGDGPDILQPGRVQQLAELFIAHRVWVTPTLLPHHNGAARRELLKNPDPRLVYIHPKMRRRLDPANNDILRNWTNDSYHSFKRYNALDAKLVVLLHKAGVRLLAGTDDVTSYCLPGFGLHDELALLVQAGLSPGEALRTATLNPAEFLGREKELGSIAVGKRADLVLLERNPMDDIRNTTSIWGVIRDGQYLDRAELDRMLETVRKRVNQE